MSVQIPGLPSLSPILSFQDLRDQFFDVFPLCTPFAPWFKLLVPLDFPLNFPLFTLLLPVAECEGLLWDHDLLCMPLPYDCLPVLLRALQSR